MTEKDNFQPIDLYEQQSQQTSSPPEKPLHQNAADLLPVSTHSLYLLILSTKKVLLLFLLAQQSYKTTI